MLGYKLNLKAVEVGQQLQKKITNSNQYLPDQRQHEYNRPARLEFALWNP